MDSTGDFTMSRFTRSPLTWALAAFLGMLGFQAGTYVGSLAPTPDGPRTSSGGALSQQRAPGPSPGSSTLVNQAEVAALAGKTSQPNQAMPRQ